STWCRATAATSSPSSWSRRPRRVRGSMPTGSAKSSPSTPSPTARSSRPASAWRACPTTRRARLKISSALRTRHCTRPRGPARTRWPPRRGHRRRSYKLETPRDILIVDDDRQVRDVLHQIFLSARYTCHLAEDGPSGLEVFAAARPPLVVTDLKMPGMSGIELLEKIRHKDGDAAVIVLTGAADVKTAIDSLKL